MAAIPFAHYHPISDEACASRIEKAKQALGSRLVILAHHYQRDEVFNHADYTGDSLALSQASANSQAQYIVFCGVHFMAEVAEVLSRPTQTVILPDLEAGCSMADMATLEKVEQAWQQMGEILDVERHVTPITYINSSVALKAFCARHGGTVCTSSNASRVLQWAFQQREKVFFFPDQHLGRYSGYRLDIPLDAMPVWDFDEAVLGGLTPRAIQEAKIVLWDGFCSVHQLFQVDYIQAFRSQYPQAQVIAHPECSFEVCLASDHVGSTTSIINAVDRSSAGSRWLVGTEVNLVSRLGAQYADRHVHYMAPTVCPCSTMSRISPQHLLWVLENLESGEVVNQITVPDQEALESRAALETMLAVG